MEEKEKIILDLTACKYIREFHERIRVVFDFPEWYGANLDALWDLLREPWSADVTVIGADTMSKDLREYFPKIIEIFDEVKEEQKKYGLEFTYQIKR